MGKKSDKGPATVDQLFVLGLDENGKPRGARFAELKDNIASAAVDMNCRVLVNQPETVSDIAMNCPLGAFTPAGKRLFPISVVTSTTRFRKRRGLLLKSLTRRSTSARPSSRQRSSRRLTKPTRHRPRPAASRQ